MDELLADETGTVHHFLLRDEHGKPYKAVAFIPKDGGSLVNQARYKLLNGKSLMRNRDGTFEYLATGQTLQRC